MRVIACVLLLMLTGCAQRNAQRSNYDYYWSWLERNRVTDVSLRGLCVWSADVAWASGQNGTVLRTTDGGLNWQKIIVPGAEELDLRDVEALDRDTAVVMSAGSPARLYRTSDGGATWTLVYENDHPDVFLDCIGFHRNNGFAFGDPLDGTLLIASSDAGQTWRRIPQANLPRMAIGEAGFAASGSNLAFTQPDKPGGGPLFVSGGEGGTRARVSPDGWSDWEQACLPLAKGAVSKGAFSVCFDDDGRGVAVGGDYLDPDAREGTACFSTDGGRTWQASRTWPGGYRSCVATVAHGAAGVSFRAGFVCVGTNGCDVSWDGGKTWERISETGYHAIEFAPNSGFGFAVGAEGRVAEVMLQ